MKLLRKTILVAAIVLAPYVAGATATSDLKPVVDSVATLLYEKSGIEVEFGIKNIMKRGGRLDFYFTNTFSDYPWRTTSDLKWFRREITRLLPKAYSKYSVGNIYCAGMRAEEYLIGEKNFKVKDPLKNPGKGLQNRNIAIWASHGLYFDKNQNRWKFQRPPLFGIVEDLLTQSFVMDYIIPMLENAGAKVFCPRSTDVETIGESGYPRFCEGASANLRAEGVDSTIWYLNEGENNYNDDLMCRGEWVNDLSKRVPIDLSFGLHTDAGIAQGDTIIGTLAIHTLKSNGKDKFPSGESRMTSRLYADLVQTELTENLRKSIAPEWTRRQLWNRSYSESRVPDVPALLLEMLSHQNFADMKYALDPTFRFIASRAIYKGMLKYLSKRYGFDYVVQPLPVKDFSALIDGADIMLEWAETVDTLEPTAHPESYIVYTSIDGGDFDSGITVKKERVEIPMQKGHIYRYKVVAVNAGGKSFPSEILAAGIPQDCHGEALVVNNFTRVSGPDSFDNDYMGGFSWFEDNGVPYMRDVSRVGNQYCYMKAVEYTSNDAPGFGASFLDQSGKVMTGNTFDYVYIHGRSLMKAGYAFSSCSVSSFMNNPSQAEDRSIIDLVCGKQKEVRIGAITRHEVYPEKLRQALEKTASGRGLIISGTYIASAAPSDFTSSTLGYKLQSDHPSKSKVLIYNNIAYGGFTMGPTAIALNYGGDGFYAIENPNGLYPYGNSSVILRYFDSGISAAISHTAKDYKTVAFGFPLETCPEEDLDKIIDATTTFFESK